ncbi:HNH endonuclease family protein [Streptomyces albidus (ex Kaewkla and Franco 2022)]|uniref:HNH endonuclease family protein n=1 Tax=Streptomyces albidus (ex Kaewkla and Franco 2022) TaxID=722709 RepID=UPI0028161521|nr:HNH endonuclease family protein [Streptomyces albidus (ex Kaewkla and Franco 2022)]
MSRRGPLRTVLISLSLSACLLNAGCQSAGGGADGDTDGGATKKPSASPSSASPSEKPSSPSPETTVPAPADGPGTSPFANRRGTAPGLAQLTVPGDRAKARDLIATVETKGRGPRTGYERDAFGYAWMDTAEGIPLARNGCDTRNDVLARDGKDLERESGSDCVVISMTLHDPYTGRTIEWRKQEATEVQIDHVMPLSYDWQMGAARWPESKREQIANDPLNLIPVYGRSNSSKGDSGPASWLPPDKRIRCSYAVRFTQVALKYELPVTAPDKRTMLEQCGG